MKRSPLVDALQDEVGRHLEDDLRRAALIREEIGWERKLMMDANQVWDVPEAIAWMQELAQFKPYWIEEPTSPDDVLGHAAIAKALAPIGVADRRALPQSRHVQAILAGQSHELLPA